MSPDRQTERPVIAVVGPTASGKSELGIALALRAGGEVINCDSVQVYREIEIATAKVPPGERRGVPHHLIDFVPPGRAYTAAEWARDALACIEQIEARGRTALLVGGSGLYLRALREPFFEAPPTNEGVRRRLLALRERRGAEHLHRLLRRLDPERAARLQPRDWSRVQRALEDAPTDRREALGTTRPAPRAAASGRAPARLRAQALPRTSSTGASTCAPRRTSAQGSSRR